jgi:hypothetical protein
MLIACGGGSSGGGGGGGSTGTLNLRLSDAPVDNLASVFITFSGVALHTAGGTKEIVFDKPKTLDLLALQSGRTATLLDGQVLAAGNYQWIRLDLSEEAGDLYVVDDTGAEHPLTVSSGAQTGLKLVRGFTVLANGTTDFTIDFDLRKSVKLPTGGDYKLRPTLKLIDNAEVGAIAGTVDATTRLQVDCADSQTYAGAVFVFEGADAVVNDADGTTAPYVTVPVEDIDTDGIFTYKAAFLPAGAYTVAYSCQVDDLETDETLTFTPAQNVTVTAKATSTANFQ